MKKGFVFGKFMPFHKGHEAMISFAASCCDQLTVLVCVSNKEKMPAKLRKQWIVDSFAANPNIDVQLLQYDEEKLSSSSESSRSISAVWANEFKALLPDVQLLVSSEPYGEFVSEYMGIEHLFFDLNRTKYPVSGTKIRKNPLANWDYLPDAVKPYYQQKVVILGTESTGKTTLAEFLSTYFSAALVKEMGRELIPNSEKFELEDLKKVAMAHQQESERAIKSLNRLIIFDTDLHITQSYAFHKFGQYLDLPESCYEAQKANLYLYLSSESPYVQDGSRMSLVERNQLEKCHRETLEKFSINYQTVSTDLETRKAESIAFINQLFDSESE
jgi:HTH-type transcriptional repressor of NAD biosynthesis genes